MYHSYVNAKWQNIGQKIDGKDKVCSVKLCHEIDSLNWAGDPSE